MSGRSRVHQGCSRPFRNPQLQNGNCRKAGVLIEMPPVVVLIVCQVALAGPADPNADFTHAENLQWATKDAQMLCRRIEVQMTDMAAERGADPQPFNQQRCQQSGIMLGSNWNESHRSSKYRFWKYACPVPIINDITKEVI